MQHNNNQVVTVFVGVYHDGNFEVGMYAKPDFDPWVYNENIKYAAIKLPLQEVDLDFLRGHVCDAINRVLGT